MSLKTSKKVDLTQMPVCLISCGETGCDLNIEEDTLKALAKRDKPAVVVAIVGLYRTGKSYLMNQLAGRRRKPSGFELGNTIQSKTKGIWIWVRPHPDNNDKDLILLDTEGLGDVKKTSREHDNWIYYLATLLSSVLVHNSMGGFNEKKVDDLSFVTKMNEDMKTTSEPSFGDDLDFDVYFPDLIVALRDFGLQLEKDGKPITADEYLEDSLGLQEETDARTNTYNEPRKYIRKYFPKRKCFTFDRPGNKNILLNLEVKTDEGELEEEFVEVLEQFQKFVYAEGPIKKIKDGSELNGRRLSEIVRCFVQNIKEEKNICIEDALNFMAGKENERAVRGALDIFKAEMELIEKPASLDIILNAKQSAILVALEDFKGNSLADWDLNYHEDVVMKCEEATVEIFLEHSKASKKKCQEVLESLYAPIAVKWKEEEYNPKGSRLYQDDIRTMQKEYDARTNLGMKKNEVFSNFKKGQFRISSEIIEQLRREKNEIMNKALESIMCSFKAFGEKKEKETQHMAPNYEDIMKLREEEVAHLEKEGNIEEAQERKKEMDARNKMHKNDMQIKEEKLAEIKKEINNGNIQELEENSTSHKWFQKQLAFWKNVHGESDSVRRISNGSKQVTDPTKRHGSIY